jgi:iron complex outermembrane receptor protein
VDGSTTASKNEFRIDLNGEFDTGPIDHKLLLAYVNDRSSLRQQQATPFKRDLFNAVDGRLIAPLGNAGPQRVVVDQAPRETGVLIMDQLSWEKWVVVAGVRQVSYAPGEKLSATSDNYNATLPSLGVVYRLTPSQSLYTSLAKSFMANTGKTEFATLQQVEPEEAQQVELGFKQLFRERQLALTAALYRIEQKNYAALDTVHSTFPVNYYVTVPGITSRGLDVEVSGRLTDHLDIRAAYNYSDIDAPTDVPSIPFAHQQYKLSLIYSLTGDKQGAWFGGGIQGRDAAQTRDYPGSPREFRMDVYGGYDARSWSLQAGVKNLTDRQNYTLESGANGVGFVIQPREIYLAAHLRF